MKKKVLTQKYQVILNEFKAAQNANGLMPCSVASE